MSRLAQSKVKTSSQRVSSIVRNEDKVSNSRIGGSRKGYSPKSRQKSNSNEHYSGVYDIRFRRKDLREFNPRHYVTADISEEDVLLLKEVFDYYDSTNIGVLLPNDLKVLLHENGFLANKKTIYEIIAEYDMQQTGGISFNEFMKAMDQRPDQKEKSKQLHHIFKKYDRNNKNYIDIEDLREMQKHLNEEIDEEMLTQMIERASKNHSKRLTYKEFYQVMVRTAY